MHNSQKGQTTSDTLLGGRIRVCQPHHGFRVAIDPVFLAAAVNAPPEGRILDVGCGVGAALFCALARQEETSGVGLDIQACMVSLAVRGIKENKLEQRAKVLEGDIALWSEKNEELFDVVL
ncbi:MAG: methyltransferase domain-containing protein, partial [Rhodospirillaceae bacterium]